MKKMIFLILAILWLVIVPHHFIFSTVTIPFKGSSLVLHRVDLKVASYSWPDIIIDKITFEKNHDQQNRFQWLNHLLSKLNLHRLISKVTINRLSIEPIELNSILIQHHKDLLTINLNNIQLSYNLKHKNIEILTPHGLVKAEKNLKNIIKFYEPYPFELQVENNTFAIIFNDILTGNLLCDINKLSCKGDDLSFSFPQIGNGIIKSFTVTHNPNLWTPNIEASIKNITTLYTHRPVDIDVKTLEDGSYEALFNHRERLICDPKELQAEVFDFEGKSVFTAWVDRDIITGSGKIFLHDVIIPLQEDKVLIDYADLYMLDLNLRNQTLKLTFEDIKGFYKQHVFVKEAQVAYDEVGIDLLLKNIKTDDIELKNTEIFSRGSHTIAEGDLIVKTQNFLNNTLQPFLNDVIKPSVYIKYYFHQDDDSTKIVFIPQSLLSTYLTLDSLIMEQKKSGRTWHARGYYQQSPVGCRFEFNEHDQLEVFYCDVEPNDFKKYFKLKNNFIKPISLKGTINDNQFDLLTTLNSYELIMFPGVDAFTLNTRPDKPIYLFESLDKNNSATIDCTDSQSCQLSFKTQGFIFDPSLLKQEVSSYKKLHFDAVDGKFESLSIYETELGGSIEKNSSGLKIFVNSEKIKGSLLETNDNFSLNLDEVDLNWLIQQLKLVFRESENPKKNTSLFSKNLSFDCAEMKWKEKSLGALSVMHNGKDKFEQKKISLDHSTFNLDGSLVVNEDYLIFDGALESDALGEFFDIFLKENYFKDGSASLQTHDLRISRTEKEISGLLELNLKNLFLHSDRHELKTFKLLNILSGYVFSKNHKRSLVNEGFPIDRFKTSLEIEDNKVMIKNLFLKSGATEFYCEGCVDPIKKMVDLNLFVAPKVSKALPAAAFLLGSIPAGLAMLGFNYFAGDDLNKLNRKHLRVHGSFDDIKIEPWIAEIIDKNIN